MQITINHRLRVWSRTRPNIVLNSRGDPLVNLRSLQCTPMAPFLPEAGCRAGSRVSLAHLGRAGGTENFPLEWAFIQLESNGQQTH